MPGDIPRLTHLVFRRSALRARLRLFKFMQDGDGRLPSPGAVLTHIGVVDTDEHLRMLAHLGDAAADKDADGFVGLLAWYVAEQPYRIRSVRRVSPTPIVLPRTLAPRSVPCTPLLLLLEMLLCCCARCCRPAALRSMGAGATTASSV